MASDVNKTVWRVETGQCAKYSNYCSRTTVNNTSLYLTDCYAYFIQVANVM